MTPFKPNLYVVARFLDRLAQQAWTKSALQRACGVNYDIFRRYLELLQAKGFVAVKANRITMTPAGADMRMQLRTLLTEFIAGETESRSTRAAPAPRPQDATSAYPAATRASRRARPRQ